MSWLWGPATNTQYEELVEKACSPLNLPYPQSEDMATNLEITDMIRSKAVLPKPAMQSLKRRVASKNGRVQMYALGLTDTCIKNGGDHFLAEVASKEFVDELSGLIRSSITSVEVRQTLLRLFQQWALAFRSKRELAFFVDVYNDLKNAGVQFPPPPTESSSHLIVTTTAPTWVDSDVCMRCRTAFTFTNRKHHCRNCGLVFDQACSSKIMPLPRFGITEEVRVCDSCWAKSGSAQVPTGPPPAVPGRTPRSKEDLDADLQRAIELSLADSQLAGRNGIGSEPPLARTNATVEDDDEELRLAIEASLRDAERARPSAPQGSDEPEYKPLPTFDLAPRETETILTFSNTLDQMAAYGERDLRRFPYAHVLAEQAYALSGKLHRNAEEKHTKQQMLAEMQDKLSQAVTLYGQILDGQQAYSARRMQEQQQRQYYQQQQSYSSAPPAQSYNPYGQTNGHTPYAQAPPHPVYSPPQQAKAGPSFYPSMPNLAAQQQYAPQQPSQAQYAPQQLPQAYRPESAAPASYQLQPSPQWGSPPTHAGIERQSSMRLPSVAAQIPQPQRHVSVTYGAPPESQYTDSQPYSSYAPTDPYTSTSANASAPPAFDIASHPSASPATSVHSALPPQPQSYRSPSLTPSALQATSPPAQTIGIGQPYQPIYQPSQPHPQIQQSLPPQTQSAQPQLHNRGYSMPQQQPQANMYNAASFPQAPAAVFPDAPVIEPHGLERQEKEEALLIEL